MEGDRIQEFKHACKFCGKSFPCGRSLGGHMRSHITNLSHEENEKEKLPTRKLSSSSLNNDKEKDSEAAATNAGYGLREKPRKTWRISDYSNEEALVYDKFCKECGKGFHSWKALFGHMKCHSEKERVSNSLEDQDSWTNAKVVMDSQSDNEGTAPNKRRRSKRRTRYTVAATTSSVVSFTNPSSSLSEVEQEQEEVAMSLMMLSRDVSPWSGPHSVAESSDNNSAYFEARSSVRTNLVTRFDGNKSFTPNIAKLIKQSDDNKWEVGNLASENPNSKIRGKGSQLFTTNETTSATKILGNGFRVNKSGVSNKGYEKRNKSELEYVSALEDSEVEHGRSRVNGTESVLSKSATTGIKYSSIKARFLGCDSNSNKNWVDKACEAESSKNSNKRGKFECTTCNKIFHSYQALGGHRASHKKIKGCFASRNESSENSIETDISAGPTTENKLMKNSDSEYRMENAHGGGFHNEIEMGTVTESKKSKGHECPICLKVFPSGQALGGHKRSHMTGVSESRSFQIQEPVPEIRDFLDLNLPAATEEECNSHADSNRPWWIVEDNHKQEALVGMIS
ncbi:hypothetical protein Fmac_026473 [Flemingia macrophylla]|uniref:C2H2-type domain-containing protein n=1 Tax=Flemingia macrophylla TaxID=520843 RepID=A0ABD1LF00_9FABA